MAPFARILFPLIILVSLDRVFGETSDHNYTTCRNTSAPDLVSSFLVKALEEIRQDRDCLEIQLVAEHRRSSNLLFQIDDLQSQITELTAAVEVGRSSILELERKLGSCNKTVSLEPFSEPTATNTSQINIKSACEGATLYIYCEQNVTLSILEANFGRKEEGSPGLCPHYSIQATNCLEPNSKNIVIDMCQGKSSCTILATKTLFGDPCPNTYKYLEVQYECLGQKQPI